jgi:hypothetical protein
MRRLIWGAALGLTAWGAWAGARATEPIPGRPAAPASTPAKPAADGDGACGNHGTSVEFVDSPKEAAARAKREQKLVFVLHVSGHFEDPRFT